MHSFSATIVIQLCDYCIIQLLSAHRHFLMPIFLDEQQQLRSGLRNGAAAAGGRGVCCAAQLQCHARPSAQPRPQWYRERLGPSGDSVLVQVHLQESHREFPLYGMGTLARAGEPDRPASWAACLDQEAK